MGRNKDGLGECRNCRIGVLSIQHSFHISASSPQLSSFHCMLKTASLRLDMAQYGRAYLEGRGQNRHKASPCTDRVGEEGLPFEIRRFLDRSSSDNLFIQLTGIYREIAMWSNYSRQQEHNDDL